ncbi:MAG: hypothetical protein K0R18_316 [Bacillales bacterium]|jgi:hypothetical protein|nr:hypothetical protein [Bacillales bacterium]
MAKESPLMTVIIEMVKHAAEEIGCEHCSENVDQILIDLDHDYGIQLNPDGPIFVGVMESICMTILEWQKNTRDNHPEMCEGA